MWAQLGVTHSMDVLYGNGRASYMPAPGGGEGGSVSDTAELGMMKWAIGRPRRRGGFQGAQSHLGCDRGSQPDARQGRR